MAKPTPTLPLFKLTFRNNKISRTIELVILFLLLSLAGYRILKLKDNGYPWFLALVCESWFTLVWISTVSTKWNQLISKTYPQRLLKWTSTELPRVDMFVTTADPELEPPIMTVNTVLSLLAVEYPGDKLACYVSDDAASPLTFYSLVEAIKFAKYWVPFCKKYNVSVRAPFQYFKPDSQPCSDDSSHEFLQDWIKIKFNGRGIAGIQGPHYQGTGCFHQRKVIYGSSPNNKSGIQLKKENLRKIFGNSIELCESVAKILQAEDITLGYSTSPLNGFVDASCQVANCTYELGTSWGKKVGWMYGSVTEDILTSLTIHARGWETAYCTPDPPAFLGCTPSNGPVIILQFKRWSTGLFEILLTSNSPIILTLTKKLKFRQCLAYLWIQIWPLRSIFETCYAILPAYCIISNTSHICPKVNEPEIILPISILVMYKLYTLSEYIRAGQSMRAWWNNQRMWKIISTSSWLFGLLSVGLKVFGLAESVFEVTKKDSNNGEINETDSRKERFTFNDSLMFIPGTFILLLNLAALLVVVFRRIYGNNEDRMYLGEVICCKLVVLYFWAFLKGLFGKGNFGIPLPTIIKSGTLMLLFVQFCISV